VKWELDETEQIRKMIRAAIITAQSSTNRGGGSDVHRE